MKTRLSRALDRWQAVAELLNAIDQEPEGISVNDKRIWDGILHDWDNEDWELLLEAVGELLEGHPAFFKQYHKSAWAEATRILLHSKDHHPRTLDQRPHKKAAWRMIMTARELWNTVNEHYSIDTIITPKAQNLLEFE